MAPRPRMVTQDPKGCRTATGTAVRTLGTEEMVLEVMYPIRRELAVLLCLAMLCHMLVWLRPDAMGLAKR